MRLSMIARILIRHGTEGSREIALRLRELSVLPPFEANGFWTIGKTNTVLEAGKSEAIERHLSTLRSLTTEINRMRLEVEATKIGNKEEITAIEAWNTEIDAQLGNRTAK